MQTLYLQTQIPCTFTSYQISRNFSKKNKKRNQKTPKIEENDEDEEEIPDLIDFTEYELALDTLVSEAEEDIGSLTFGSLQPSMLEEIEVKAYGDLVILMDLAQIMPKSDTLIHLNIYDKTVTQSIKKALDTSGLDLEVYIDAQQNINVNLANTKSKEAKESFIKLLTDKNNSFKRQLKDIKNEEESNFKKLKEHLQKDIIFQAEKEIFELFKDAETKVNNIVKEKMVEAM